MIFYGYHVFDWAIPIERVSLSVKAKTNIIGEIYQNRRINVQQSPYAYFNFVFKQDNNEERGELRDYFIANMGKNTQFFMRSFKNDLKLLKTALKDSNVLYVMQGYDEIAFDINAKFLYIVGHPTAYTITSMVSGYDPELDIETVAVAVNPAMPFDCEAGCTLIEFLYFGRWDTDTLTFDYDDIISSTAPLTFREASDVEVGGLV